MKAETLKKSILQYAMQGKLVKQDPNDEPACELLKRIKAEKEKLIKEGKIKKEKPLPPITQDEIPYELPQGWEWVRLKDIVYNHGQKTPDRSFCYIDIGSIDNKKQCLNIQDNIICPQNAPSRARKIVKYNDVIYSTVRPYLHNICIINRTFTHEPIASTGFAVLTCHFGIFNKYLFYYLLSPEFDTYANNTENSKGVAYPAINDNRLYNALIPLPPLAEQQRIVDKLEQILPLVEEYGKNEEKLSKLNKTLPDKIKQSVLQHAVQGKLVPQNTKDEPACELLKRIKTEKEQLIKDGKIKKEKPLPPITQNEIPYDIPTSWTWCRVNDIGIYKKGPFGSALTKKIFVPKSGNAIKVYEQKNAIKKDATLGEYYISKEYYEKSMKSFTVSAGDVIVSCAGTIGETYVMPQNIEFGIINQALMRMTITKEIDLKYFLTYFEIIIKKDSNTYSKGSAIKNIPPFEIFKSMLVPLPPLAEQKRIVGKVEELMTVIEKLKV